MDKTYLNNFIIRMRLPVKEATRRTFQKIKNKEKKLNSLLTKINNDKNKQKLQNQLMKCLEEENLIKSFIIDDLSRIALTIPNLEKSLNDSDLSLEEKLKAKIANHPLVQNMVNDFKIQFPCSEQWMDIIVDLWESKKRLKLYKNKKEVKKIEKTSNERKNILCSIIKTDFDENNFSDEEKNEIKDGKIYKRLILNENFGNVENNEKEIDFKNLLKLDTQSINLIKKEKTNFNSDKISIKNIISEKLSSRQNEIGLKINLNEKTPNENEKINEESKNENKISIDVESIDELKNSLDDQSLSGNGETDENFNMYENDSDSDYLIETNEDYEQVDVKEKSKEYLNKQLLKVFGDKIASKNIADDVSSDESIEDDFFINKRVKKFKSTKADIERYKDLHRKEYIKIERTVDKNYEIDSEEKKMKKHSDERRFKTKSIQSNIYYSNFVKPKTKKTIYNSESYENKLHPSWEAKKKSNESLKIDLETPNNKKIVFE